MRWSALSTWEAGLEAGLLGEDLRAAAVRRAAEPSFLPATDAERQRGRADRRDRGHPRPAPPRRPLPGRGRARRRQRGSSSAPARTCARSTCSWARAACCGTPRPRRRTASSAALTGVSPEGWQQPEHPRVVVDRDYVLAAVGLLAERRPAAAAALARSLSTCDETRDELIGDYRTRSRSGERGRQAEHESSELRERIAQQWAEVRAARRAMEADAGDRRRSVEPQARPGALRRGPRRGLGLAVPRHLRRRAGHPVAAATSSWSSCCRSWSRCSSPRW